MEFFLPELSVAILRWEKFMPSDGSSCLRDDLLVKSQNDHQSKKISNGSEMFGVGSRHLANRTVQAVEAGPRLPRFWRISPMDGEAMLMLVSGASWLETK
ncbi:unnamed protein product [Arabis nemorensis]|uniref:Uncharacterized protein n=1 Tax=Arabis nemorensis TaxID=586526 RepID=A0A565ATH0_9BRAS|nr:unnamed protein product [Arabis nemorensis]